MVKSAVQVSYDLGAPWACSGGGPHPAKIKTLFIIILIRIHFKYPHFFLKFLSLMYQISQYTISLNYKNIFCNLNCLQRIKKIIFSSHSFIHSQMKTSITLTWMYTLTVLLVSISVNVVVLNCLKRISCFSRSSRFITSELSARTLFIASKLTSSSGYF